MSKFCFHVGGKRNSLGFSLLENPDCCILYYTSVLLVHPPSILARTAYNLIF